MGTTNVKRLALADTDRAACEALLCSTVGGSASFLEPKIHTVLADKPGSLMHFSTTLEENFCCASSGKWPPSPRMTCARRERQLRRTAAGVAHV